MKIAKWKRTCSFFNFDNLPLIRYYWCLQTPSFYVTSFFMFANIHLHVTSQRHDITSTLIAIQCDSLCANCRFLKTGLVDHVDVLQTQIISIDFITILIFPNANFSV